MSQAVAQELEARLEGVGEDVRVALTGWVATRRRLAAELSMKLGALSAELAAAERRFVAAIGHAPARTRDEAWRAFGWVRDFERERRRIEEEVWDLLARARADERAFVTALHRQARTATAAPALVAEAMSVALDGEAEAGTPLRETALGRGVDAARTRALAAARAEVDRVIARLEGALTHALARGVIDWERVSERFAAATSERLAGEGGAPARPRPRRAPAPPSAKAPAPKRKRARVPKFLLGGFYKKGNMRRVGDDIEITFVNPLAFCIVQNGDPVIVDGRAHPTDQTTLDNGEKRILGTQLGPDNYLKYAKGAALKLTLIACALGPGSHRISLSLELRKMGWIDLNIEDEVS